jgi:hypothetical protein
MSTPRLFNCYFWARLEYRRLDKQWEAAGKPKGQEPYLLKRRSRREPRKIYHYFVGYHDPTVDAVRVRSYKPVVETDEPWWKAWKHMLFNGEVREGDTHYGDL